MIRVLSTLLALLLGASLSGCIGMRGESVDMQGAAERADRILDGILTEIEPDVRWVHGPTTVGSCTVTRRRTVMTIVSAQRRGNFLGVVDRHWKKSGFRLREINAHADAPAMYAETKDGFVVSLIVADKGQVHFDVDSPCVQESEVAAPTRQATAPLDPEAEVIPRPNIHSDFWSAETPEVGVTPGR